MSTRPLGMLREESGYVAKPDSALTRWPTQGQTNWTAVDPPRVWDMLQHEDDEMGWEQVKGLRTMAGLLTAQADRLTRHRETLAQLWPAEQSQAAALALSRLDELIGNMRADSEIAIQNALAIDGIMTTTAKAKREVHAIVSAWEMTTNDGGPEWWDREAARLSYVTQQTMTATERAIREHRAQIVMPNETNALPRVPINPAGGPNQPTTAGGGPQTTLPLRSAENLSKPVVPPSLPGHPPLISPLPSTPAPDLQGGVPALPGQPVSMLPIAPGNPYAPNGGAYVLPGPGVGSNGFVVALPPTGSGGSAAVYSPARTPPHGVSGLMPMPVGGPMGQPAGHPNSGGGRRGPDTRWEVARGVAPVIQPDRLPPITGPTAEETEENFRQWFTQTAMPWRTDEEPPGPAPVVTIRRATSQP